METLMKDPSLSPSKQIKSKRKTHHHLHHHHNQNQVIARLPNISRQSSCSSIIQQKYAPPPHVQLEMVQLAALAEGGVFLNHYPRQISHSSSLPPILPTFQHQYHHHHRHQNEQHQQPPLLPLPVASKPTFRSLHPPSSLTRSHSVAGPIVPRNQPNKTKATKNTAATKNTKTTTIKKKPTQNLKKENKEDETKKKLLHEEVDAEKVVGPAKGVGPDLGSLPKEFMTRVLSAADLNEGEVVANNSDHNKAEKLIVPSIFNLISPPPSSLPLPKFTMRQNKLSCNAEAAADEVDTGATDNLCRLLKLR